MSDKCKRHCDHDIWKAALYAYTATGHMPAFEQGCKACHMAHYVKSHGPEFGMGQAQGTRTQNYFYNSRLLI